MRKLFDIIKQQNKYSKPEIEKAKQALIRLGYHEELKKFELELLFEEGPFDAYDFIPKNYNVAMMMADHPKRMSKLCDICLKNNRSCIESTRYWKNVRNNNWKKYRKTHYKRIAPLVHFPKSVSP